MEGHELLRRIALAISPVVMLSLTAILINGVANKDADISERIRQLTRELREQIPDVRRTSILAQLPLFVRRVRSAERSLLLLYLAELDFVVLVILLVTLSEHGLPEAALFVTGLLILAAALALEVWSHAIAGKTMERELRDSMKEFDRRKRPREA
jgi:hypothetical protein